MKVNAKNPLVALLLASLLPGSGHLYTYEWKKAIVIILGVVLYYAYGIYVALSPEAASPFQAHVVLICFQVFRVIVLLDSFLSAIRFNRANQAVRKPRSLHIIALGLLIILANGLDIFFDYYAAKSRFVSYVIPANDDSMYGALEPGEKFYVDRDFYKNNKVERGDIVIFRGAKDPQRWWAKRIIGLPGETVEIWRGRVRINGKRLPWRFTARSFYSNVGDYGAEGTSVLVPPGHLYVLNDKYHFPQDSRFLGPLPENYIIGKVLFMESRRKVILSEVSLLTLNLDVVLCKAAGDLNMGSVFTIFRKLIFHF